ncbi:FYVE zinc finger domain-containing protein [Giardia duodenalis]|uniref:FYVE zinc finger domain-containing protein n=1 Tax=Giardia intestinalis (strain ATCC 50803 / WB clone C6) TaxID=184922 RepID=A8BDZ8_GIAIC|nr:FYVE zinc finger domain-containing protein [Giardia intestinalis]KAE8305864.1 FYVE zinc finger domain-containing protein [Giardia intestinalis]|eukprot:XP_001707556.1 Hypothetical protein GL50803_16653 [Giardia lamblia ATCC 50803]
MYSGPYNSAPAGNPYGGPPQMSSGGPYGAGAPQAGPGPYGSSMPSANAGPYGAPAGPYGAQAQGASGPYGASQAAPQPASGPYGSTAPGYGASAQPYGAAASTAGVGPYGAGAPSMGGSGVGGPGPYANPGGPYGSSGQPPAGLYGSGAQPGMMGGPYGAQGQMGMGGPAPGYEQTRIPGMDVGGYSQGPVGGPQTIEPIEEVKRVRFHMTNGYEFSLSIAIPHKTLVPRTEWIQDKDVNNCQGCDTAFTLLNRRHHCRRCGRIFCNACCIKPIDILSDTGTDRLCKLCKAVMLVVDGPPNPLAYDVKQFLEDQSLSVYLTSQDHLMAAEYIRLIQNNLRNNDSRTFLMQYRPQLIYRAVELLDQAVRSIVDHASRVHYITLPQSQGGYAIPNGPQMMNLRDASTIISHSLGLLINLTSTSNKQFASALAYIREVDTIGIIVSVLTPEVDLVKQELAIWALRNITADPGCIPRIMEHRNFVPGVARLLGTAVRATGEFITSLIGNIALAAPDYVPRLLPSNPIPNMVDTHEILKFIMHNIDITAHVTQCMAMRLMGLFAKNAHSKDILINYKVHESIVAALAKRAVEFFTTAGNSAAMALDSALRYVRSETMANPMKDVNEAYVMSGGFFALGCFVELDEEAVTKAIIDGIFGSRELTLYLMKSISRETAYTCVESSYFLRVLLAGSTKEVSDRIIGDEQYKSDFIRNVVIVLDRPFIMETVTTNCQSMLSALQNSDNSSLATEINTRLKGGAGSQGQGGVNIAEALSSNYAGAEMNETDLKRQATGPYGVPSGMNISGIPNPYSMPQQQCPVIPQQGYQGQPSASLYSAGQPPVSAVGGQGFGQSGGMYGQGVPQPASGAPGPYGSSVASNLYGAVSSSNPYAAGNPSAGSNMGPYGAPQQGYSGAVSAPAPMSGSYGAGVPVSTYGSTPAPAGPGASGPYGAPQTSNPYGAPAPASNPYGAATAPNPYGAPSGSNPYKTSSFHSEELA